MASAKTRLLCQLQSVLAAGKGSKLLDGQLLEQFTTEHDQAAFATLVRRHGPMVLNVCRRVLHNAADAEDAFQATFLVLARKAPAIGKREALPAWLHKVAFRVALRARAGMSQRQKLEHRATGRLGEDPLAAITGRELLTVLDEEPQALPAPCRAPLILCYLEEHTREEAARQLGLTLATLKRRLERGRALLRRRLERRGLALATAFLTLDSFQATARATLPSMLAAITTRVGMQAAAGKSLAEVSSAQIAVLVSGTLRAMALGKILVATTLLITVTLVGMGIGFRASLQDGPRPEPGQPRSPAASAPREPRQAREKELPAPAEDLPAGARARLGSARFLNFGRVFGLAYSPDGRLLASGAWDGSIRIWSTTTGKEQLLLDAHKGPVQQLVFSPDGKLLASAGRNPGLCLWEVATGRFVKIVQPELREFSDVAFSPDGRKLAGIAAGKIYVWDETGKEIWSEGGERSPPQRMYIRCAFSGDDSIAGIFSLRKNDGHAGFFLRRRSFRPEKELDIEQLLPGYNWTSRFGPDGKLAAFQADYRNGATVVSFVHLVGTKAAPSIRVNGSIWSSSLCISPDGRMIAWTGDSWDGDQLTKTIRVYEICTGQERYHFECGEDKGKLSLAFSRDCRTLSSGSLDVTVLLWDLTGQSKKPGAAAPLTRGELDKLWMDLKSRNAEHAFRSLWTLVRAPRQATAYLAKVLQPVPAPDLQRIANLVRDLSDKRFAVRLQATNEIRKLDELAEAALREALRANPELEPRQRIERLLGELEQLSPEKVRELRAVEALERMHTPQADDLLRKLARGAPGARLTREAADACRRLKITG